MEKTYNKVLFVDFPIAIGSKLATSVEDVLDCNFCDFIGEDYKKNIANLKECYDFIFIYRDKLKSSHMEFLSKLRQSFPMGKLFVVTEREDYQLVLAALRAGVRDIISYPIDQRQLVSILSKASAFGETFQNSWGHQDLLELSRYIENLEKVTSFKQVFQFVQIYILNQPFAVKMSSFYFHVNKKESSFYFGTRGDIALSPLELITLSKSESEDYFKKGHSIYIPVLNDGEGVHFLLLEVNDNFEKLEFDYFLKLVISVVRNFYGYVEKNLSQQKMTFLAHTDDVTGLYNQRRLYHDIDRNIDSARANGGYFSLIFLDIDKFKDVNDEYGHIIGSKLLMQVAGVIRKVIRETDYIYRYGGDEFVIIIPSVRADSAVKIGERLLREVSSKEFIAGSDQVFKLGVSIGIAEYPTDAQRREDILAMADKMMYQAKKSGRGQICLIRHQEREKLLS